MTASNLSAPQGAGGARGGGRSPSPSLHQPTNRTGDSADLGGSLGKDASSGSAPEGQPARERRWALRRSLRRCTSLPRVATCGHDAVGPVDVVSRAGIGHVAGVVTCGSVHACPVCSARIRETRAREVEQGLRFHVETGGAALFVTLTAPHDAGDALATVWDGISKGLRGVWGGRAWMADRERFGVVGVVRALEVTHGASGWHPHVHALLLTERPLSETEHLALLARLSERWQRAVTRAGLRSPSAARGVTLYPVASIEAVASYATKIADEHGVERSVGREMTRLDLKAGRWFRSRTPFAILADFTAWGDADDLALWHEWERVSHGRKALVWSRGLKGRLGITDRTDDEIAAEIVLGTVVARLDRWEWRAVADAGLEWDLVAAAPEGPAAVWAVVERARGRPG